MEIIAKVWIVITYSIISGILYRWGGSEGWNTKVRDFGVPLVATLFLLYTHDFSYIPYILTFLLTFLSLTTYYDEVFGYDNLYAHGLMVGLASLPLAWVGVAWWLIVARAFFLGLFMGLLNRYANKWQVPHSDIVEEFGRGFLIVATLPIIC